MELSETSEEVELLPGDVGPTGSFGFGDVSLLANRLFKLGQKESGLRRLGGVQDFRDRKDKCLRSKILFEDEEFPTRDSSLFYEMKREGFTKNFVWKRPQDILSDESTEKIAKFSVNGTTRFDVIQDRIGDCWFLAALSSLTMHPQLFSQVVPDDNGSLEAHYAGIFHFRFWQSGKWVDVVINDRLPMYDGRLIGVTSTKNNEFWSALLEKAYAKLYGSYEALDRGGLGSEALRDLTGGVVETYTRNGFSPNLFKILLNAYEKNSLMTCGLINPHDETSENARTFDKKMEEKGLITNHEYSITCATSVHSNLDKNTDIPLVRIRNPWGKSVEWTGPWHDEYVLHYNYVVQMSGVNSFTNFYAN